VNEPWRLEPLYVPAVRIPNPRSVQRKILRRGPCGRGLPAQCLGIQAAGSLERVNTHEHWKMVIVVAPKVASGERMHMGGVLRLVSLPGEESREDGCRRNGLGSCRDVNSKIGKSPLF
jgi:hypothetical protein